MAAGDALHSAINLDRIGGDTRGGDEELDHGASATKHSRGWLSDETLPAVEERVL